MRLATWVRIGVAVLVVASAAACGAPQQAAPSAHRPPPTADPVTVCHNQLEYWAGEELRGAPDQGFDYQHRGLTSEQADALDRIVEQALSGTEPDVPELVRAACVELAAAPSSAPWGT